MNWLFWCRPVGAFLCIVAGAQFRIRRSPDAVPFTLSTFGVCAASLALGRDAATAGAVLYCIGALTGQPVYAGLRRAAASTSSPSR